MIGVLAKHGAFNHSAAMEPAQTLTADHRRPWWETRGFIAVVLVLTMVPLLYPAIPPLVDLPGHMGRYRVELDLARSPTLQQYFGFHWTWSGNLGVDLLIIPVAHLFGLEPGVKLITMLIPPLTAAGFLWVAREVHGRIPPTALFAIPFVYGHSFLFGFINYQLSMALAFLAFALWLRLGRLGRTRIRALLFVPISFIVFITHVFGFGVMGILCFSAELAGAIDQGRRWIAAIAIATKRVLPLAGPLVLLVVWRAQNPSGTTTDWFDFGLKQIWIEMALRDRWMAFDRLSILLIAAVLTIALLVKRLTFSPLLAVALIILLLSFAILPRILFGSAYADMRLVPFIFAVALLAIGDRGTARDPMPRLLAAAGLCFVLVRLTATTVSLGMAAQDQQAKLAALDHIPVGARVISFVGSQCDNDWPLARNNHLGSFVIIRRAGFSNDQWRMTGAPLLTIKPPLGLDQFGSDPSQQVREARCADDARRSVDWALATFPRDRFDYVWLIDPPTFDPRLAKGLLPVWSADRSTLYRIVR